MEPILDRIRKQSNSALPHIQRPAVLLQALDETLTATQTLSSPTAYFAAVTATLKSILAEPPLNTELLSACLYLESSLAPFVPSSVFHAKSAECVSFLIASFQALQRSADAAPALKSFLTVSQYFYQALPATELADMAINQLFNAILPLIIDVRPKLRRKAYEVVKAIVFDQRTEHPYRQRVIKYALDQLTNAYKQAKQPKGLSKEAAMAQVLALCSFIDLVLPQWPPSSFESLLTLLLSLPSLDNQYITVSSFEIIERIFSKTEGVQIPIKTSFETLMTLRPANTAPRTLSCWLRATEHAFVAVSRTNPDICSEYFQSHFQDVLGLCESSVDNEDLQSAAEQTATSMIRWCMPLDQEALTQQISKAKIGSVNPTTPVLFVARLLQASLTDLKYQGKGIVHILNILLQLVESLKQPVSTATSPSRPAASLLLASHIAIVGNLRSQDRFEFRAAADKVLGSAAAICGPEWLLDILPLNILDEDGNLVAEGGRAWLLPLLRTHIFNTHLSHFVQYFVPLSEKIFAKRASAKEDDSSANQLAAKIYETLLEQIWALLPAYCDLPTDLADALTTKFVEMLGQVLYAQPSLRPHIFRALDNLVKRNQALRTSAPPSQVTLTSFNITAEMAASNLQHIAKMTPNLLSVMFNIVTKSKLDLNGVEFECITSLISVTAPKVLASIFTKVDTMLSAAVKKADDVKGKSDFHQAHAMLDLAIALSAGAPLSICDRLYNKVASKEFLSHKDGIVQKKSYKMMLQLSRNPSARTLFLSRTESILRELAALQSDVSSSAKKERIELLARLVELVPNTQLHLLPLVLPEVVLSTKEANEKTREASFELLSAMAEKMQSGGSFRRHLVTGVEVDGMEEDDTIASVDEFVTILSAGLTADPHMISATIGGLAKLTFDFHQDISSAINEDVLSTVIVFMGSNTREVTKSAFGYFKVALSVLPDASFASHLPEIMPNLLKWGTDHKNHFNLKVRHLLERLIRKFGFDEISKYATDDNRKILTNIRKRQARSKKKKLVGDAGLPSDNDEEDNHQNEPRQSYKSAFEQVLYGDSDSEGTEPEIKPPVVKGRNHKKAQRKEPRGAAYLREGEEETYDLLDKNDLDRVTNLRNEPQTRQVKHNFKTDKRGRMLINEEEEGKTTKSSKRGHMEAADAFLAAVNGQNPSMAGKKRLRYREEDEGAGDDWVNEVEEKLNIQSAAKNAPAKRQKVDQALGKEFKAKKAQGDVSKTGGVQPYAYVTLQDVSGKKARHAKPNIVGKGKRRTHKN